MKPRLMLLSHRCLHSFKQCCIECSNVCPWVPDNAQGFLFCCCWVGGWGGFLGTTGLVTDCNVELERHVMTLHLALVLPRGSCRRRPFMACPRRGTSLEHPPPTSQRGRGRIPTSATGRRWKCGTLPRPEGRTGGVVCRVTERETTREGWVGLCEMTSARDDARG